MTICKYKTVSFHNKIKEIINIKKKNIETDKMSKKEDRSIKRISTAIIISYKKK